MTWQDLSDDELRARLYQRGVEPEVAQALVEHREHPYSVAAIDQHLTG